MTGGSAPTRPSELRALRRSLLTADDQKILRVVTVVDEMADRGEADALVAPLRPRLSQLRPPRPLRFERLLFMPLDPLIVPATEWRVDQPMVPRTALRPIARTVRQRLGADVGPIEAGIAGRTTADGEAIARIGSRLWPAAACLLDSAPVPRDWAEAGLRPAAWEPLTRGIAAVLHRLAVLEPLMQDPTPGATGQEAMQALLTGLRDEPPGSQAMVIALMLAQLPQAGELLQALARTLPDAADLRRAGDQAAAALLGRLEGAGVTEARVATASLADLSGEVSRLAELLDELELHTTLPDRRGRLTAVRRRLDQACRDRFGSTIDSELLEPLRHPPTAIDRDQQTQLEATARQLRTLETTARKLGGAADYDARLRAAAATVETCGGGALTIGRATRLLEILAGPDAAMTFLEHHS
jgi:hypothetical protein